MPRQTAHIPLNVFVNGRLVGQLKKETTGAIAFQYDVSWLEWKQTFPVSCSLPLRADRYTGKVVTTVFDNLLPDNDAIRQHLAQRTGAEGDDAYSLLAVIGRDCVGALQFLPLNTKVGPIGQIEGKVVASKAIEQILKNLGRIPLGITGDDEFRISIAGMQEKTALLRWEGGWRRPLGNTATTHIFKPQIGKLSNGIDLSQSVENEHFCMSFLANLGLPTAQTKIQDFGERRVLVVTRFDRRLTKDGRLLRLPQEDCCQALSIPPAGKYETDGGPGIRHILQFLRGSDDPGGDQKLFLQAQMAFWLLGATDGHAKNFSIFLRPGGRYALTPLYDVMSAQPNVDAGQIRKNKMKMAMAVGKNRHYAVDQIVPRHFIQTAELAGIPGEMAEGFLQELAEKIPGALRKTRLKLPKNFSKEIADSVSEGIMLRKRLIK